MKNLYVLLFAAVSLITAGTREIAKNIPVSDARTVEILGYSGSTVTIKTWAKNEVSIRIKIDYSVSDKEKEAALLRLFDMTDERSSDKIILRFVEPNRSNESFSFKDFFSSLFSSTYSHLTVTGEVYLPSHLNLFSDMRYGTYTVDGVKGTLNLAGASNTLTVKNCAAVQTIENNYGTTIIDQSGGSLELDGESSKITVTNFKGSVNARANYSAITYDNIANDVTTTCTSGQMDVESIGGNLTLTIPYATAKIENVIGAAEIESNSATVRLKNIGGVSIKAPYSNVFIESVTGKGKPVYVENTSGRIDITGVSRDIIIDDSYSQISAGDILGNVKINGNGTTLKGKKINGNFTMMNQYGNIRVDQLSASAVEIHNKSNDVDIELVTKPLTVNIINQYGPVSLSFPDFSGEVQLKASYAAIKTNLPIEKEALGGGEIAIGTIGNGSGKINIKTESGDIQVRQRK
jgi:DUF4097 and DUF4098 domain-containing protein YvlB